MSVKMPIVERLLGTDGFGPKKFTDEEGAAVLDQMTCWLRSLKMDQEESVPLDQEKSDQIINIARHKRAQSFANRGNGDGSREAWEQVQALADDFIGFESEAYFRRSLIEAGFQSAREATMLALTSGYVLNEIQIAAKDKGSAELQKWLAQLNEPMRDELEKIIAAAAKEFWSSFIDRGWSLLKGWLERIIPQPIRLNTRREIYGFRALTYNGKVRYTDNSMPERPQSPVDAATTQSPNDELCPEEVISALYLLSYQMYGESEAKPGRKSSRIDGIIEAVKNTRSIDISLEDLKASFEHTKNPRKTAASYMSDVVKLLNLSGSAITVDAETIYRFRRRPSSEPAS